MAKKSMIARDVKRKKLVERFASKRWALLEAFHSAKDPMERLEIHRKIQAAFFQSGFLLLVGLSLVLIIRDTTQLSIVQQLINR